MTLNIEQARHAMIEQQIRPWDVVDSLVLKTLAEIAREDFVPEQYRDLAFSDVELPIGHDQKMFKPVLQGRLLQALQITANDEVLEVGTGSGFMTACLSRMARAVTSMDIQAEFIAATQAKLSAKDIGNVQFEHIDIQHIPTDQHFDAILVNGALQQAPENLKQMLRPNGRLVIICGQSPAQSVLRITRTADGFQTESLFETDVPYLQGAQPTEQFSFA